MEQPGAEMTGLTFNSVAVETANHDQGSIFRMNVLPVRDGVIGKPVAILINPECEFMDWQTKTRTQDMKKAAQAPAMPMVRERIQAIAGETVMVGNNFDVRSLEKAMEGYNLPHIQGTWLDTKLVALAAWPELFKHRNTGMPMITSALGINFRKDNGEMDARAAAEIVIKASKHTGLGIEELLGKTGAKTENSPVQEELRTVGQVDPEEEARAEAAEAKAKAEAAEEEAKARAEAAEEEAKARAEAAEAKARAEAAEAKARAEAAEAKAKAEAAEAKARAEAAEAKARAEAAEAKARAEAAEAKARAEAAEAKAKAEAAEAKARAAGPGTGTGPRRRQHPVEPEGEKPPNSEWEEKLLAIIRIEEAGGFLNKTVAQGGLDSFIDYWAREIRSSRHGTSEICPWLLSMKYRYMNAAGRSHYVDLMRRMLTGERPEPEEQDPAPAAPGPETGEARPREARNPAAGNTGARENRNQERPPAAAQPTTEDARQERMNKRELIAAMCIAELAGQRIEKEEAAQEAVEYADELLRALKQPSISGNSGRETPPPRRQG